MPFPAKDAIVVTLSLLAAFWMPVGMSGAPDYRHPLFAAQAETAQQPAPETPDASSLLDEAQQLIQQGKLKEARKVLSQGLTLFPHEPAFLNFLGVIDAEENDFQAAEENFHKAILEAPAYAGAYLNLGHLYQAEVGKKPEALSKAIATYRRLLRFDPGNIEAMYQDAALQMQQGRFKDSLGELLKLPAAARQNPRALAVLCADHAALGHHQDASDAARRLLASAKLSEADVTSIIPTLSTHHQESLAIQLLEGLAQRHLASASALNELALLAEHEGKLELARHVMEQASVLEPQSLSPLLQLAHIAQRQHDDRGALGYLAHARALAPENASVHFFFGMICVEMDLHQEAYVSLKKAVALDPDNPYYNYALGAVCTQREDPHEAVPYFRKYCALKPEDPRGKLALGAAWYYSHDLDLARAELLKIVNIQATSAGANYYLGRIANDQGHWAEAVQNLKRAIRKNPQYADAYAMLGNVYLNQKDYENAGEALRRALQLDPDNYLASLKLTVLYERTKDPRAADQARHFAAVRNAREQRAKLFLRTIRVVP